MVRTGRNAGNFEFAAYWVVLTCLVQDIFSLTCHHFFLHDILYRSGLTSSGDVAVSLNNLKKTHFLHGLVLDILRQLMCSFLGTLHSRHPCSRDSPLRFHSHKSLNSSSRDWS